MRSMVDMSSGGRFMKSMAEMSGVSRFHEEHGGDEQGKQVP